MRLTRVMAIVIGAVALQIVLARYAVGGRFTFDLVLVGVVFVALQSGAVAGMLGGTVGGLLQDVASGGIVGVSGLVIAPSGRTLVSGSADATVRFWTPER